MRLCSGLRNARLSRGFTGWRSLSGKRPKTASDRLDESQRAMVAAKLANLPHGTNQWSGQLAAPTQERAADMLNVGERCEAVS
jgi:hypothetical protein